MAAFFLLSIGGIYGVFVQYVVPMRQELMALEENESQIRTKIEALEKEFGASRPEEYIELLRKQRQPWIDAARARTPFFDMETYDPIEVPENVIPRFWYREKFPEIEQTIDQIASEKGVYLNQTSFGERRPEAFGTGTNPSREEIMQELNKFSYGVQMTEFILGASPYTVESVVIWPSGQAYNGVSGIVTYRTTGYRITISWERLLTFLQKLSARDTYITIEAIKIQNSTLRNPNDPVNVELIVTEAQFKPHQKAVAGGGQGGGGRAAGSAPSAPTFGGFGGRSTFSRIGTTSEESEQEDESSGGVIEFIKGLIGL